MSAPLDRLVLELTEHEQVEDCAALNAALQPARARGLRLAVDDAGAGCASMRHWLLLQPDLLKLDVSLVRDVDADDTKRALCAAIITFAQNTGIRVVAEGVETEAELAVLRALGADYGQGYLLRRPAPLAELSLVPAVHPRDALLPDDQMHRRMLEMQQVGCSAATIAAPLNALGERRSDGVRRHRASVQRVLDDARSALTGR